MTLKGQNVAKGSKRGEDVEECAHLSPALQHLHNGYIKVIVQLFMD